MSGANPLDDVVIWGQTPVLSNTFIKKTKRATAYGDSDGRLKNAALEIARAAPGWARYQDSKTLAEKIVSAATSFDKAEKRRLIALPPISLGLVAAAADDTESKQLLSKKSNAGTRPRSGSFS